VWRWVTDHGLRIASGEVTLALYHRLIEMALPGVVELVPADGSLLVVLKPGTSMLPQLNDILNIGAIGNAFLAPGRKHEVSVKFEGQDLPAVAERLNLPIPVLIESLCEMAFKVKFLGFQPGFAYLEGLPKAWQMPRLKCPRKKVPAGSVALGGAYCGIYPAEGPGGWHLIGRTDAVLFDPALFCPALFQPGDTIRLVAA
jgi:KipI family sensor histidine kinase inhibitor